MTKIDRMARALKIKKYSAGFFFLTGLKLGSEGSKITVLGNGIIKRLAYRIGYKIGKI